MNKRAKTLIKLSYLIFIVQVVFFVLTLWVIYEANHDSNPTDLDGLGAIAPAVIFSILGLVNFIVIFIYLVLSLKYHKTINKKIILIALGAAVLLMTFGAMANFIDTL